MRTRIGSLTRTALHVAPAVVIVPLLAAWGTTRTVRAALTVQPESSVWVDGTSSVRPWHCTASDFDAKIGTASAMAVRGVLAGDKTVTTVDFTVPIAGMDCNHNNTMNEHMRKALKAAENPAIVFHLTSYELARGDSGLQATLTGNLAMGGTEKPVTINATVAADSTSGMRMKGTVPIHMKEFGLKPPTLMLGVMKVNELVTVGFDLLLKD